MRLLKPLVLTAITATIVIAVSCKKNSDLTSKTSGEVYLDLPEKADAYFKTSGTSGNTINDVAALGRVLFYDTHLSLNNSVSCGTCHKQELAFADNAALSRGFDNRFAGRNTPPIQNLFSSFSSSVNLDQIKTVQLPLFWDARENSLVDLVSRPISNHIEMGVNLSELPAKLAALPYYPSLFKKAFGTEVINIDRIGQSVAAFMSAIKANNTRFDKYDAGNTAAFTAQEISGMSLFATKYECGKCHQLDSGQYESEGFADIGLDKDYKDRGAGVVFPEYPELEGNFKIPNLRNVALTAPYMHDGRYKTLEDVIEHYSKNIKDSRNLNEFLRNTDGTPMRMNISEAEKQALVAFLRTLTDNDMITDPKFSNPFKVR